MHFGTTAMAHRGSTASSTNRSDSRAANSDPSRPLRAAQRGALKPCVPFNRSSLVGREMEYIAQAMTIGQIAGDQAFSRKCQGLLERELGAAKSLLTTSCTHALEMAALLLNIAPGDEVIVPSFTFVSTANAFVLRGASPIFCRRATGYAESG